MQASTSTKRCRLFALIVAMASLGAADVLAELSATGAAEICRRLGGR